MFQKLNILLHISGNPPKCKCTGRNEFNNLLSQAVLVFLEIHKYALLPDINADVGWTVSDMRRRNVAICHV